jgi:chaperonin GroES
MFYEPISDGVTLERVELQGTSKGGIIVPASKKSRVGHGLVRAVGPGRITDCGREEMDVKVGDYVLYEISAAMEVDNYIIVPQQCIFAVCQEDGKEFKMPTQIIKPEQKIHTVSGNAGPILN